MPRRDPTRSREPRSGGGQERSGPRERRPAVNVDEQALSLREANASYSTIARRLGLKRATDAHRAFIRAISSRSGEEQQTLVAHEHARLDRLEVRIRDRDAAAPDKIEHRLLAVGRLRAALP